MSINYVFEEVMPSKQDSEISMHGCYPGEGEGKERGNWVEALGLCQKADKAKKARECW